MSVVRCTIVEPGGTISFVADEAALPALLLGCQRNAASLGELLELADPYFHGLRERVLNGLAIFDERNAPGNYDAIHHALEFCQPHEQPPFRVVDDVTREASLRPVRAGAVLFNLVRKRIVQLQSGTLAIGRTGRGHVFDGERLTPRAFLYRLPREWQIVP